MCIELIGKNVIHSRLRTVADLYCFSLMYPQELNDMTNAVKLYKDVLHYDNTHVEAIACIATHHFYTDQPEIALRFYR